MVLESVEV